ncbi:hypothetical protein [Marichromatium sp. AB31]|uniref:hypothetical protein n=1 Tax=Marichromatium sp. AB31 TaxID=2483362 RepID=UPI000F3C31BC|nr:hypothetical protein [Marichromatium sp. AB31]RNE89858.1 hypothetical protein EBL84_09220 [Marichromatium sp. AB31]
MRRTAWNESEDDALHGLPWSAQLIYLRALRPHMDYASGIVGQRRGISLRGLAETLHVEHGQGRRDAGDPSQKAIRHALELLEKAGLIEKIPADRRLVFRLPLADTDSSASEKWGRRVADVGQSKRGRQKPSNDAASPEMRGRREADPEAGKRGTHPDTGIPEETTPHTPPSFALPDSVDPDIWREFEAHRREIRKPLTDRARKTNAKILAPLTTEQQRQVVEATISNRWTGLFPPKPARQTTADRRQHAADELKRNFERHDWTRPDPWHDPAPTDDSGSRDAIEHMPWH